MSSSELRDKLLSLIPDYSSEDQNFAYVLSSGTKAASSEHKVYKISKMSIDINAKAVNAYLGARAQDKWVLALSDKHIAGIAIKARAEQTGSEVLDFQSKKWDPSSFHAMLTESQAAFTSIVPAQLFDLVKNELTTPPKLKYVLVGAGFLSQTLLEKALALGWPVLRTYSMTETASTVAIARDTHSYFDILPCHQVRSSSDQILEIKSECLFTGYWHFKGDEDPQFVEPHLRNGWWKSSDRGETHDSKHLNYFGRADALIKINGFLVDKSKIFERFYELRDLLLKTTALEICFKPDARAGHLPVIFYEQGGVEPVEIKSFTERFNAELPSYSQIFESHALTKIPRSALGKFLEAEALSSLGRH